MRTEEDFIRISHTDKNIYKTINNLDFNKNPIVSRVPTEKCGDIRPNK